MDALYFIIKYILLLNIPKCWNTYVYFLLSTWRLYLFDEKHSKNSNIVKYYYSFNPIYFYLKHKSKHRSHWCLCSV